MTEAQSDLRLADGAVRRRAIDPRGSFLVQAPAGSGKTSLLTQRFLALLGVVERPEEILALTFTRKAAAEMRERISAALLAAAQDEPPETDYEATMRELAATALARSRDLDWRLEESTDRLQVMTLDAFNRRLALSMPLSAGIGRSPVALSDHAATQAYERAAGRVLAWLGSGGPERASVERLLGHLDNDAWRWGGQIGALLGKRDQWLRQFGVVGTADEAGLRREIERTLTSLIDRSLVAIDAAVPDSAHGPKFWRWVRMRRQISMRTDGRMLFARSPVPGRGQRPKPRAFRSGVPSPICC